MTSHEQESARRAASERQTSDVRAHRWFGVNDSGLYRDRCITPAGSEQVFCDDCLDVEADFSAIRSTDPRSTWPALWAEPATFRPSAHDRAGCICSRSIFRCALSKLKPIAAQWTCACTCFVPKYRARARWNCRLSVPKARSTL